MRKALCKNLQELMEQVLLSEESTVYIVSAPSSDGVITIIFLTEEDLSELLPVLEMNGLPVTLH